MKKELAIENLIKFASLYSQNLIGKKLLFIYYDFPAIDFIEAVFPMSNFRHLTGIQTQMSSSSFFLACMNNKLSPDDFDFSLDGTTELKFQVFEKIVNINTTARYLGEFKGHRPWLMTEKLVGDHTCCLGVKKDDKYYVPNTVLNTNIINEVYLPAKEILATCRTKLESDQYDELCYQKPKTKLIDLNLTENLIEIINPNLLI